MNRIINVDIEDKIAVADNTLYICGNSDFVIHFSFDDEWAEHELKTARFISNGTYADVVFSGNVCAVPVISNTYSFKVGVYAGDLQTTTPAIVSARKSILCGTNEPMPPHPDVYAQIQTMFQEGVSVAIQSAVNSEASAKEAKEHAETAAGYANFDWFPILPQEQYNGVVLEECTVNSFVHGIDFTDSFRNKGADYLNVGDTVLVFWNPAVGGGGTFECTVKKHIWKKEECTFDGETIYIGNFGARFPYGDETKYPYNGSTPESGEPFYIELYDYYWKERKLSVDAIDKNIGKTTFSVYAVQKTNYIPDKFLSGTIVKNGDAELTLTSPGGKQFKITVDDNGKLTTTEAIG